LIVEAIIDEEHKDDEGEPLKSLDIYSLQRFSVGDRAIVDGLECEYIGNQVTKKVKGVDTTVYTWSIIDGETTPTL
jgi:hypothetical protein